MHTARLTQALLVPWILAGLAALPARAQGPPNSLHFQARIADAAGNALNGPVSVQVRIYDVSSGGVALFSETHAATALNGVVNLVVGSISSLPATLFDGTSRFLAIQVGADPEMSPRRPIVSVPFASRAALAAGLAAGSTLPTGLVTSAHILDGTIAAADLAANSVGATQIASSAVTNAKIATGAVSLAKLAADSVDDTKIVDGTITFKEIAPGGLTLATLAANSVDGSKIVDGSITAADLAASAITATQLATSAVTGAKILDGTITSPDLGVGSVGTAAIADGSITLADLSHPLASTGTGNVLEVQTSGIGAVVVLGSSTALSGGNFGVRGEIANTSGGGAGLIGEALGAGGTADGVRGIAVAGTGYAVWGDNNAVSGSGYAVRGSNSSTSGTAIFGSAGASTGSTTGVEGSAVSTSGTGVFGQATANTGATFGVRGVVDSTSGIAVLGDCDATSGLAFGVVGFTSSVSGMGVYGKNLAGGSGVMGESPGTNDNGVEGKATGTGNAHGVIGMLWGASTLGAGVFGGVMPGATGNGVVGDASSSAFDAVRAEGDFTATGFKSFAQPHPTDSSREIHFVCLEGNESGTYFRGSAKLVGGVAVIDVPEEFRLVSESAGLTVQVTPIGKAQLWCESKGLDRVVIQGDRDVEFDYLVNGVRRGFAKYEPFRANRSFVPRYADAPFGAQYPEAIRAMLVANGTLNADFTPNAETAVKRGWPLRTVAEAHPDLSGVAERSREATKASRAAAAQAAAERARVAAPGGVR